MIKLDAEYRSRGVITMYISGDDKESTLKFMQSKGVTFPVGIDGEGATFSKYGVSAIPDAVVIDPDGNIVWTGHPDSGLERAIDTALQRFPDCAETLAQRAYDHALARQNEGRLYSAYKGMKTAAKTFGDTGAGKLAAQFIADVEASPERLAAVEADQMKTLCEPAMEEAYTHAATGNYTKAKGIYRTIVDNYPDSNYASQAQAMLDKIAAIEAEEKK